MIFCKNEKKYYTVRFGCKNCAPNPNKENYYYGVNVQIPKGITIKEFLDDKQSKCSQCGVEGMLFSFKQEQKDK